MPPAELWGYLAASCKGVRRVEDAKSRLKIFLGRILVQVQKHPELYQAQGYPTFNEFASVGVDRLFGVSRNEAFICKKIAEELGDSLSIQEMSDIGISNLNLAANAIRQKVPDGAPPDVKEREKQYWIKSAKTDTYVQLRERMAIKGLVEEGDLEMAVLAMSIQKSVRDRWMEFRKQPWVRLRAGETDSMVLDALMQEASCWEGE
jgi:hypothetical protein